MIRRISDAFGLVVIMLSLAWSGAAPPTESLVGATGFGLPITRSFAAMHDSELTIESIEGEGTVATIRFPPWRTDHPAAAKAAT